MMHSIVSILLYSLSISIVIGDVYLHNPRGSNNRLNEATATRTNNDRLFDSQNNNRGGYNVGDANSTPAADESQQYNMVYIASGVSDNNANSYLTVEWTLQHGCGGQEETNPYKLNCVVVLQHMCTDDETPISKRDTIRNGITTNSQTYTNPNDLNENLATRETRYQNMVSLNSGLHEPASWYDACYMRSRNKGLFVADQNLQSNVFKTSSAIYTRQNPAGTRRGYECPEERDYYPYWETNPWIDIAVLTDDISNCKYYQEGSFNSKPRSGCIENGRQWSRFTNELDCTTAGGKWVSNSLYTFIDKLATVTTEIDCLKLKVSGRLETIWAIPYDTKDGLTKECLVLPQRVDCVQHPWSRVNHLGNTLAGGEAPRYEWRLPTLVNDRVKRCVFRIRYNISTDDYDSNNISSANNGRQASPVLNNPSINVGLNANTELKLALNTAQTGRVFQDRSHVFLLKSRNLLLSSASSADQNAKIYNLNVRGKRGNIVQTYPAVEYDFIPNRFPYKLQANADLIHLQWTGSNTHNNGAPGGDGQTGNDGQGAQGTDRHNLVPLTNPNVNYPAVFEWQGDGSNFNLWRESTVIWSAGKGSTTSDYAIYAATGGYLQCEKATVCGNDSYERKVSTFSPLLDNAAASFEGIIFRVSRPGIYHYACTRNNNFSNRSQKGTLVFA